MAKTVKPKRKKYSISLSEREGRMLQIYADSHSLTRPEALRHLVKSQLHQINVAAKSATPENQLGLFDSIQVDIFNNTAVNTNK